MKDSTKGLNLAELHIFLELEEKAEVQNQSPNQKITAILKILPSKYDANIAFL